MNHATPTAATSASPPLRGQGLWVGDHPSAKPRPGTEPGPRLAAGATSGASGQARGGLRLALALALLAPPATAQIIPTGSTAADILLSTAIAEQRVFHTCSALDDSIHPYVLTHWREDTAAAIAILQANAIAPEAIAAFTEAARPENLLPAPDTTFEDVRALCAAHPDWQVKRAVLNFIVLEFKLPQAFE